MTETLIRPWINLQSTCTENFEKPLYFYLKKEYNKLESILEVITWVDVNTMTVLLVHTLTAS